MEVFYLQRSTNPNKKYQVTTKGENKTIHFGASGYSDFTRHRDTDRKANYLRRHKARENWKKSGVLTPGFWSRWLLWNKPTLAASMEDVETRFNIKIVRK